MNDGIFELRRLFRFLLAIGTIATGDMFPKRAPLRHIKQPDILFTTVGAKLDKTVAMQL